MPAGTVLANGSFESNYTGWTATGNQLVPPPEAGYVASAGVKNVAFNAGQSTPNGVLSQTFMTTPGQAYVLAFDVGALSFVNQDAQWMQVTVQGSGALLDQTMSVVGPGNGTTYVPLSFVFVANSTTTTLTFRDVSLTTTNIDLVLDNVRVTVQ